MSKSPEEIAKLQASAKAKQAAALANARDFENGILVAGLTEEQFKECRGYRLMYELTRDEYEALFL